MLAIIQNSNAEFWTKASFYLPFLVVIISLIVYLIQQQSRNAELYHSCTKSLYSDNPIEQSTAAILLRSFLNWKLWMLPYKPNYSKDAKNLMVVLLRDSIPVKLQKTLADGFSYAGNLDGQDFQYVNMVDALIKPKSRIKYERTGRNVYKTDRISMCHADFYHAVLQECSINNVNANGAIFLSAILCGTSFKNCILNNANFENSNIRKVKFDQDCSLEGASFKGAVGIDTATIKINGDNDSHPLINFLDEKGIFHSKGVPEGQRYYPKNPKLTVFVSKLGSMDSKQRVQYDSAIDTLKRLDDIEIKKIEREHYPIVSQLIDVKTHLDYCDGCIIFAFEYLNIESGYIHKNVVGEDRKEIKKASYPSPWLHIEAALANGQQIPCLIIYSDNICRDGMFDDAIIQPDKNLFAMPYSDTLTSENRRILLSWFSLVRENHNRNHS